MNGSFLPVTRMVQDAAAGLFHEMGEMRLTGRRGSICTAAALAVASATMLALAVHVDEPWWAAISAFMCSQATAPASVQKGILRILGTIGGAGLVMLLSPWLAGDAVAVSLALLVVSTTGVIGQLVSGHGYAWLLGAITADMVLMALLSDPASTLTVGVDRVAEVVIGTLTALAVALLLGPAGDATSAATTAGWADLLDGQWPAVRHAVQAGIAVMLVPLVWNLLELPGLQQTAITVTAVMAVPALSNDAAANQDKIRERAIQRIIGCFAGGLAGLGCLGISMDSLLPWILMLTVGTWISAHVQASERGISYVGTQAGVVLISTLVQGSGPPTSILPGIERFAGILGGLLILLTVRALTAPDVKPPAVPQGSVLSPDR
jgi:uncharacterized membrane protein YccC